MANARVAGMPRWVKVLLWVTLVLAVAVVAMLARRAWATRQHFPRHGDAAMSFSPGWRRALLTLHVATSVGFIGAVAAFLALAIAGVSGAPAVYLALPIIIWPVIGCRSPCCSLLLEWSSAVAGHAMGPPACGTIGCW